MEAERYPASKGNDLRAKLAWTSTGGAKNGASQDLKGKGKFSANINATVVDGGSCGAINYSLSGVGNTFGEGPLSFRFTPIDPRNPRRGLSDVSITTPSAAWLGVLRTKDSCGTSDKDWQDAFSPVSFVWGKNAASAGGTRFKTVKGENVSNGVAYTFFGSDESTQQTVTVRITCTNLAACFGRLPPPAAPGLLQKFCTGENSQALVSSAGWSTEFTGIVVAEALTEAQSRALSVAGMAVSATSLYCYLEDPATLASPMNAHAACGALSGASVGLGVMALGTAPTVVGGVVLGIGALATGIAGSYACSQDPPDPSFRTIAKPKIPPVRVAAREGLSPAQASVAEALARNAMEMQAVGNAMMLCMNRASGAAQAKDKVWETRQRGCVAQYARRMAGLYRAQVPLRKSAAAVMRQAGVPDTKVDPAGVAAILTNLSADTRRSLRKLGLTNTKLALAKSVLAELKLEGKIPATAYDAMNGPKTIAALNSGAKAFDQIATKYS